MTDSAVHYESAPERRRRILSKLRSIGFLSITDLTRELGVSHMTVRRDLHALNATGRVRMVHGGISMTPDGFRDRAFPEDGHAAGRVRVAKRAAGLIGLTNTIAIDAGPTAYALIRDLPENFRGSVITHSLPVLHLIDEWRPRFRAVGLGGELAADRDAFVGAATEGAVEQLRACIFFFSPTAVDAQGTYARSSAEASVQRKLIEIAEEVVLIATHDVFTTSAPARIAPLDQLTTLVTDRPLPHQVAAALCRAEVITHVAGA